MSRSDPTNLGASRDVRMRGFASRTTVEAAWKWVDEHSRRLGDELIELPHAAGRVLAADVQSTLDVPAFDRAMMDGFAVRAEQTLGATAYNPLEFKIVGKTLPGRAFEGHVEGGQSVQIMTGAPMPAGADAVLPAEWTEVAGNTLRVMGEVSPGKHVGRRGEDVVSGTVVFQAGRRLRPQDVGVLASLGLNAVSVVSRPRVRIVVTGNELLSPGSSWQANKIYDANTPMLRALVERDGGLPIMGDIVPDEPEAILATMRAETEVVLVSGGSSVGEEDHAPGLLARHGELSIHGIAMRPAVPPAWESCSIAWCFSCPAIRSPACAPTISSPAGRFDCWAVFPRHGPTRRSGCRCAQADVGRRARRLRARGDRGWRSPAAGDWRGVDPHFHDAGRWLRRGAARQRRLPGRSGSRRLDVRLAATRRGALRVAPSLLFESRLTNYSFGSFTFWPRRGSS